MRKLRPSKMCSKLGHLWPKKEGNSHIDIRGMDTRTCLRCGRGRVKNKSSTGGTRC